MEERVTAQARARWIAVSADAAEHAKWLRRNGIGCFARRVTEVPYTGLIFAGLLAGETRQPVLDALLAGTGDEGLLAAITGRPLLSIGMPSTVVDLVLVFGDEDRRLAVVVEHKRFGSPSNAPPLTRHEQWLDATYQRDFGWGRVWQTDLAYYAIGSPPWLDGVARTEIAGFILLDALRRTMEEMFPAGQSNEQWSVMGYAQFGRSLRISYEAGATGLAPLLSTLYADDRAIVGR